MEPSYFHSTIEVQNFKKTFDSSRTTGQLIKDLKFFSRQIFGKPNFGVEALETTYKVNCYLKKNNEKEYHQDLVTHKEMTLRSADDLIIFSRENIDSKVELGILSEEGKQTEFQRLKELCDKTNNELINRVNNREAMMKYLFIAKKVENPKNKLALMLGNVFIDNMKFEGFGMDPKS